MALENRKAFTLVELLVVIVIIGMLMALLLPAVLSARGRARQTQCTNRQQELGKALLQYEGAKGYLPGYVNSFGTSASTQNLSWVIMVFQYLGEGDLWKKWRDQDPAVILDYKVDPENDNFAAVTLPGLICPTDDRTGIAPLSYVVNCGLSNYGLRSTPTATNTADVAYLESLPPPPLPLPQVSWDANRAANAVQDPAYGLFFDHTVSAVARTRVMLDKISDGAQHTIMLSENIQASQWVTTTTASPPRARLPLLQLDVGIVWWTERVDPPGEVARGDGRMINDNPKTPPGPVNPRFLARPSSGHPGGVVVTFADGHSAFQDEDMDYGVYQSLMTPEVSKARTQGLVSQ